MLLKQKKKDILKNEQPQSCTIQPIFLLETKERLTSLSMYPTTSPQDQLPVSETLSPRAAARGHVSVTRGFSGTGSYSLGTG